jgi:hypothetical protein
MLLSILTGREISGLEKMRSGLIMGGLTGIIRLSLNNRGLK